MAFDITGQLNLRLASGAIRNIANEINSGLKSAGATGVTIPIRADTSSIKAVQNAIQSAGTSLEKFSQQSGLAFKRFAAFSAAALPFIGFASGVRSALTQAIDFDKQMVRLRQVSVESASEVGKIGQEVTRLSTTYGVSSQELIKMAVVLKQADLSAADTAISMEALAKSSLAPNFDSMAQTGEGAIAVLKQFGIQANELDQALGSMNAVAGAFAVEAGDLVETVRRAGGAFKSAGGDLNELYALFTSVRQTTRESAESIATGLRTIFTRIQRNDTVKSLEQFGVNLRYTREEAEKLGDIGKNNQFVGVYEAINRLSTALSSLPESDARYSAIVEDLGGYRQISKVIPLIQQQAISTRALMVAEAGRVSLTVNATQATDSYANRLTKLQESYLAFGRSLTDGASFKTAFSGFETLAKGLLMVLKVAEPLLPLLTAMATVKIASKIGNIIPNFVKGAGYAEKGPLISQKANGGLMRFSSGGMVPGVGDTDSVPAYLPKGSYVIRKSSVKRFGASNLSNLTGKENAAVMPGEYVFSPEQTSKIGIGTLDAINSQKMPGRALGGLFDRFSQLYKGKTFEQKREVARERIERRENEQKQKAIKEVDAIVAAREKKLNGEIAKQNAEDQKKIKEGQLTERQAKFNESKRIAELNKESNLAANSSPQISSYLEKQKEKAIKQAGLQDLLPGPISAKMDVAYKGNFGKGASGYMRPNKLDEFALTPDGLKRNIKKTPTHEVTHIADYAAGAKIPGAAPNSFIPLSENKNTQTNAIAQKLSKMIDRAVDVGGGKLEGTNYTKPEIQKGYGTPQEIVANTIAGFSTKTFDEHIITKSIYKNLGKKKGDQFTRMSKELEKTWRSEAKDPSSIMSPTDRMTSNKADITSFFNDTKAFNNFKTGNNPALRQQKAQMEEELKKKANLIGDRENVDPDMLLAKNKQGKYLLPTKSAAGASGRNVLNAILKDYDDKLGAPPPNNNGPTNPPPPSGRQAFDPLKEKSYKETVRGIAESKNNIGFMTTNLPELNKGDQVNLYNQMLGNKKTQAVLRQSFLEKVQKNRPELKEKQARALANQEFSRFNDNAANLKKDQTLAAESTNIANQAGQRRADIKDVFSLTSQANRLKSRAEFDPETRKERDAVISQLREKAAIVATREGFDPNNFLRENKKGKLGFASADKTAMGKFSKEYATQENFSKKQAEELQKQVVERQKKMGDFSIGLKQGDGKLGFSLSGIDNVGKAQGAASRKNSLEGILEKRVNENLSIIDPKGKGKNVSDFQRVEIVENQKKKMLEEYVKAVAPQIQQQHKIKDAEAARLMAIQKFEVALKEGERVAVKNNKIVGDGGAIKAGFPGSRFQGISNILNSSKDQIKAGFSSQTGFFGAQALAGYAASGLSAMNFDPEDVARNPNKTGSYMATKGLTGALSGAGIGAAAGMAFGPLGAGIGAAVGGLYGFVTSLRDASASIGEAKIAIAVKKTGDALTNFAKGTYTFNDTNIKEFKKYQNESDTEISKKSARGASTFGFGLMFSQSSYDTQLNKNMNENMAAQAVPMMDALTKMIEEQAMRSLGDDTGRNRKTREEKVNDVLFNQNGGLGGKLLGQFSAATSQDPEIMRKKMIELFTRTREAKVNEERKQTSETNINKSSASFGSLSSAVEIATQRLTRMTAATKLISDFMEGSVTSYSGEGLTESLQRPFGSDKTDFMDAVKAITKTAGVSGGETEKTANAVLIAGKVLPSIISAVRSQPVAALATGADMSVQIGEMLRKQLNNNGVDKYSTAMVTNLVQSQVGTEDFSKLLRETGQDMGKVIDKILGPMAEPLKQSFSEIAKNLDNRAKQFSDGLAELANRTRATGELMDKANASQATAVRNAMQIGVKRQLITENQSDIASIGIGLELQQTKQQRLTGFAGAGNQNPNFIGNALGGIYDQIKAAEKKIESATKGGDITEQNAATIQLTSLKTRAADLGQALRNLTDVSERTSQAQEKLGKIQSDREGRSALGLRYATANTEGRAEIAKSFQLLGQAAKMGTASTFGVREQNQIFSLLSSLSPQMKLSGMGGLTVKELSSQLMKTTFGGAFDLDPQSAAMERALDSFVQQNYETAARAAQMQVDIQQKLQGDFFSKLESNQVAFIAELSRTMAENQRMMVESLRMQAQTRLEGMEKKVGQSSMLGKIGVKNDEQFNAVANSIKNGPEVEAIFAAGKEQAQIEKRAASASLRSDAFARDLIETSGGKSSRNVQQSDAAVSIRNQFAELGYTKQSDQSQLLSFFSQNLDNFGTGGSLSENKAQIGEALKQAIVSFSTLKQANVQSEISTNQEALKQKGKLPPEIIDNIVEAARNSGGNVNIASLREAIDAVASTNQKFSELNKALDETRLQVNNIGLVQARANGGQVRFFNKGGWGSGGSATPHASDTVNARIAPNEFVVSAGPASKNKALLEHMNTGGRIGYAEGGQVDHFGKLAKGIISSGSSGVINGDQTNKAIEEAKKLAFITGSIQFLNQLKDIKPEERDKFLDSQQGGIDALRKKNVEVGAEQLGVESVLKQIKEMKEKRDGVGQAKEDAGKIFDQQSLEGYHLGRRAGALSLAMINPGFEVEKEIGVIESLMNKYINVGAKLNGSKAAPQDRKYKAATGASLSDTLAKEDDLNEYAILGNIKAMESDIRQSRTMSSMFETFGPHKTFGAETKPSNLGGYLPGRKGLRARATDAIIKKYTDDNGAVLAGINQTASLGTVNVWQHIGTSQKEVNDYLLKTYYGNNPEGMIGAWHNNTLNSLAKTPASTFANDFDKWFIEKRVGKDLAGFNYERAINELIGSSKAKLEDAKKSAENISGIQGAAAAIRGERSSAFQTPEGRLKDLAKIQPEDFTLKTQSEIMKSQMLNMEVDAFNKLNPGLQSSLIEQTKNRIVNKKMSRAEEAQLDAMGLKKALENNKEVTGDELTGYNASKSRMTLIQRSALEILMQNLAKGSEEKAAEDPDSLSQVEKIAYLGKLDSEARTNAFARVNDRKNIVAMTRLGRFLTTNPSLVESRLASAEEKGPAFYAEEAALIEILTTAFGAATSTPKASEKFKDKSLRTKEQTQKIQNKLANDAVAAPNADAPVGLGAFINNAAGNFLGMVGKGKKFLADNIEAGIAEPQEIAPAIRQEQEVASGRFLNNFADNDRVGIAKDQAASGRSLNNFVADAVEQNQKPPAVQHFAAETKLPAYFAGQARPSGESRKAPNYFVPVEKQANQINQTREIKETDKDRYPWLPGYKFPDDDSRRESLRSSTSYLVGKNKVYDDFVAKGIIIDEPKIDDKEKYFRAFVAHHHTDKRNSFDSKFANLPFFDSRGIFNEDKQKSHNTASALANQIGTMDSGPAGAAMTTGMLLKAEIEQGKFKKSDKPDLPAKTQPDTYPWFKGYSGISFDHRKDSILKQNHYLIGINKVYDELVAKGTIVDEPKIDNKEKLFRAFVAHYNRGGKFPGTYQAALGFKDGLGVSDPERRLFSDTALATSALNSGPAGAATAATIFNEQRKNRLKNAWPGIDGDASDAGSNLGLSAGALNSGPAGAAINAAVLEEQNNRTRSKLDRFDVPGFNNDAKSPADVTKPIGKLTYPWLPNYFGPEITSEEEKRLAEPPSARSAYSPAEIRQLYDMKIRDGKLIYEKGIDEKTKQIRFYIEEYVARIKEDEENYEKNKKTVGATNGEPTYSWKPDYFGPKVLDSRLDSMIKSTGFTDEYTESRYDENIKSKNFNDEKDIDIKTKEIRNFIQYYIKQSESYKDKFKKADGGLIKFASGGLVPGVGNTDSVRANLPVGSYVVKKSSVQKFGADNLAALPHLAKGGVVPAMVMPGEHIFTPTEASKIGISRLDAINQNGGLSKYNNGSPGGVKPPVNNKAMWNGQEFDVVHDNGRAILVPKNGQKWSGGSAGQMGFQPQSIGATNNPMAAPQAGVVNQDQALAQFQMLQGMNNTMAGGDITALKAKFFSLRNSMRDPRQRTKENIAQLRQMHATLTNPMVVQMDAQQQMMGAQEAFASFQQDPKAFIAKSKELRALAANAKATMEERVAAKEQLNQMNHAARFIDPRALRAAASVAQKQQQQQAGGDPLQGGLFRLDPVNKMAPAPNGVEAHNARVRASAQGQQAPDRKAAEASHLKKMLEIAQENYFKTGDPKFLQEINKIKNPEKVLAEEKSVAQTTMDDHRAKKGQEAEENKIGQWHVREGIEDIRDPGGVKRSAEKLQRFYAEKNKNREEFESRVFARAPTYEENMPKMQKEWDEKNKGFAEAIRERIRKEGEERLNMNPRYRAMIRQLDESPYINKDKIVKKASGGIVPGYGSGDHVPALLEPGEAVIPRKAVQKFANGGVVGGIQGFANGGMAQGGGPELLDVAAKFNQAATQISQGLSGFSTSVSTFNGAVASFGTFVDKFDEAVGKIPGQIELSGANEISVNLMGQDSIVKAVTEAIGPMIAEAIRANQPVEQRSQ